MVDTEKNIFYTVLLCSIFIKLLLAHIVPITGDEAEYIYWGQHPAWGYYDHPPMIGWLLAPLTHISVANVWMRLPQIITTTLIGYLSYAMLKSYDVKKAYLIGALFLLSPVSVFNQGILTDTPLMLFTFLSVFFLFLASRRYPFFYSFLSGFCLGAAYCSKYLVFPVALSILLFFILKKEIKHRWTCFFIVSAAALPFFIQNLIWNYHHDWVNFLFNLDLRNTQAAFNVKNVALFVAEIFYVYSPLLCYYLIKYRKSLKNNDFFLFNLTALIPILFFFLLSLMKKIGLHWIFFAYPIFFLMLFHLLNRRELIISTAFMAIYTGIQCIILVSFFYLPLSIFKNTPYFETINWFLNNAQVISQIRPEIDKGFMLTTPSYAQSYLLAYKDGLDAAVWGVGSVHGRHDDLVTDFKKFDHHNILIVDIDKKIKKQEVQPYFSTVTVKNKNLNGMVYRIFLGTDFYYDRYRQDVLQRIFDLYYQVPDFLPRKKAYFASKYDF